MGAAQQDAVERARELQSQWYGEPLGNLFRRLIEDLGLNQARLAAVLGLSAPMLSQLMSGQRAKIGNPAVVQRVQLLQELAGSVARGETGAAEATDRMEEIRRTAGASVLAGGSSGGHSLPGATPTPVKRVVREIQGLLRSVSDAAGILEASAALKPSHPELAEFLAVYGAGRTSDAVRHYEEHQS